MSDENRSISVTLRLQRITCEDAHVSVPVTSAITKQDEDGTFGINIEALVAEAIRIGKDQGVEWKVESCQTVPHPVQTP